MNLRLSPERLAFALLLVWTTGVYWNHFQNSFHFDDAHTIVENVAIRKLDNLGRFFVDPSAFSVLPTHQSYRPILSVSLALDYWLGGGLKPLAFHLSTFAWYLALLWVLYRLYVRLLAADPGSNPEILGQTDQQPWLALFATALFALHPASAETVNYIIQRGDLYSTLGVAASLLLYLARPQWRKYGIYLIPFLFGALSKPPALVFPILLIVYLYLFETGSWARTLRAAVPSLALGAALAILHREMTAPTFNGGGGPAGAYWITQTWITLRYFGTFFWPVHLTADDDTSLFVGFPPEAMAGTAFLLVLATIIAWTARRQDTKPIAFGLSWFLITLAPTSLMPLAEPANDHRLFLPFVGLVLAVCSAGKLLLDRMPPVAWRIAAVAGLLALAASSALTYQRNEVWRTEETLWRDVTEKSPRNGRGWMNYGLTQMSRGNYDVALQCLERAAALSPNYPLVEINTGIVLAALNRGAEAEAHFLHALELAPAAYTSHHYYGRWLLQNKRYAEAIARLTQGIAANPGNLDGYHLLMQAYFEQQNWSALEPLARQALTLDPADAVAQRYLDQIAQLDQDLARQQAAAAKSATPEAYLSLSLAYYRAGRFPDCVSAAEKAAELGHDFADAYNNLAACHNALGQWDEGIAAATHAIASDPANQLARNNLAWAIFQKQSLPR